MNYEAQLEKMKELEFSSALIEGEYAYGISLNWYGAWKDAVGFNDEIPTKKNPGPINNNDLFLNGKFNTSKIEGTDFAILTKQEYQYLHKIYGGGPELTFPIEHDSVNNKNVAIVHLLHIKIYYQSQLITYQVSPLASIRSLLKAACQHFGIDYHEMALFDYWDNTKGQRYDSYQYISQLCFADPQPLLIDHFQSDINSSFQEQSVVVNFRSPNSGICGFNNLGNTCFLNSALQCLMHTKPLIEFFLTPNWESHIVRENNLGTSGAISQSFTALAYNFWCGNCSCIAPRNLRSIIVKHAPHFFGYQQQDAQELIITLLDLIHEDLNEARRKIPLTTFSNFPKEPEIPQSNYFSPLDHFPLSKEHVRDNLSKEAETLEKEPESKENRDSKEEKSTTEINESKEEKSTTEINESKEEKNTTEINESKEEKSTTEINESKEPEIIPKSNDDEENEETPEEAWKRHISKNNSPIVNIFHGQLRSKLHCPICGSDEIVYDPFISLSLPVPGPLGPDIDYIFVPLDASQKRVVISISQKLFLMGSRSLEMYTSQLIGRSVSLIYGHVSGDLTYWISHPVLRKGFTLCAFEVQDRAHFYCPVCLSVNVASFFSDYPMLVEGPFLIELPSDHPTSLEIQSAIDKYFGYLWSGNATADPSQRHMKTIKAMKPLKDTNSKITFISKGEIKRDPGLPCVSSNPLILVLNSNYVDKKMGFRWDLFVKPFAKSVKHEIEKPSLASCIEEFRKPIDLDSKNQWYCQKCKRFVCANKKMDIYKAPQCLLVHFKRFIASSYGYKKNGISIDYPDELDLSPYVIGPHTESMKYRLYAVSFHLGNIGGGHYLAAAYGWPQNKWFFFDDSQASECDLSTVHHSSAYMLFYQRIDE